MAESLEERFQCLHEFIKAARNNLDRNNWDYLIGGAESETTVARNRLALDSLALRPRVLRDVSTIDSTSSFLGKPMRIPVLLAPVGSLEVFNKGAGAAVAEAVNTFGNGMLLSSASQPGLEETSQAAGNALKIYQLYVLGDQAFAEDHIRRSIDAGYDALCLTVDTAHYSRRERDTAKRHDRGRRLAGGRRYLAQLSWRQIDQYKSKFKIPMILKGIATVADAELAIEHGVEAVYVSNHGGRQLDQGLGTMDMLPEIVAAVNKRARVIVDGGISRGTDVVKALALGADVVAVGRLYVYGLAAAGAAGVVRLLEILEDEIQICLGLSGLTSFKELDKSYVSAGRPVTIPHVHSAFPHLNLPHETY